MSLTKILDDVVALTDRADARSKALLSLNNIIQDICNNADFPEDLIETSVANPTPGSYKFTISTSFPALPVVRKFEYVIAGGLPQKAIKPRNAITETGCSPADSYYRAGSALNINASRPVDTILIGYYQQTPWLSETSDHWLADAAESLLVLGTAAAVFRATGDDDSGREYEGQYRLARQTFRRMRVDSEDL